MSARVAGAVATVGGGGAAPLGGGGSCVSGVGPAGLGTGSTAGGGSVEASGGLLDGVCPSARVTQGASEDVALAGKHVTTSGSPRG